PVAEPNLKSAMTIGFQGHPAVIHERGLGDSAVTCSARKFESHGWTDPLAGAYPGNVAIRVNAFIVAAQVVMPNGAAGRNDEPGGFIGDSGFVDAGNDKAEGDGIVEGT